jgi:hypothetical protein
MTSANLALAYDLWHEGLSASEIGRRVGCNKNSLLSYAHRRGWPPRPSPLGRRKRDLLPSSAPQKPAAVAKKRDIREACRPLALAVPTASFGNCQWPTTPGRPWGFCGCPTVRGPWCADHLRAAYVHRSALVAA